MNFAGLRPHHAGDDVGELPGARDRDLLARGDDGAGDGAGMPFFAEDVEDLGKIDLGGLRNDVCRGRTAMSHAHIERPVQAKRVSAAGVVDLHRRHPDIHHHAIDPINALCRTNFGQIRELALDQRQAAKPAIDKREPAGDGGAVAVDADDARIGRLEKRVAVPACPKGGIDINPAVMRRQHLDGLAAEHGNMTGGR